MLGHVQRGGTPTAFDRVLATRFGLHAIDAADAGRWGTMTALRGTEIELVAAERGDRRAEDGAAVPVRRGRGLLRLDEDAGGFVDRCGLRPAWAAAAVEGEGECRAGRRCSVYVAAPLCAGAKRELGRRDGRAGEVRVRAVCLRAGGRSGESALAVIGADARRAIEDSTTVGYIGEPEPPRPASPARSSTAAEIASRRQPLRRRGDGRPAAGDPDAGSALRPAQGRRTAGTPRAGRPAPRRARGA